MRAAVPAVQGMPAPTALTRAMADPSSKLAPGHCLSRVVRASKVVSPRGDDYTLYEKMSWWWHNDDHRLADLDLFYRVGSDTANYYEVRYRYSESPAQRRGWKQMQINLAMPFLFPATVFEAFA